MTGEEALRTVEGMRADGMKPGLDRMYCALDQMGHPERQLRVVHIAGTNGKGSTARMIQAAATACGYKTGLYASPSVTGLLDTITIDGLSIPPEAFAAWTQRLLGLDMGEAGALSEFELTTLAAIGWFAEQKVELCVIECGMGGRGDATNVWEGPLVTVLTPVALDHTAWLGETVEQIAENKCGILKRGAAVVTAPGQPPDALAVLWERAAALGLTVRQPQAASAPIAQEDWRHLAFSWAGRRYTLPLTGAFQRDNALTALEALDCLRNKGYLLPEDQVAAGLAEAAMPCRQEVLRRDPLVVIDGAHNPHGIAALAASLQRYGTDGPLTMVAGMLADKDTARCASILAPLCARIVCCTPDNPRALPAARLAEQMAPYCADVAAVDSPEEALRLARESVQGPLLVAGSFYLASWARKRLLSV